MGGGAWAGGEHFLERMKNTSQESFNPQHHDEHEYSFGATIYGIDAYKNKDPLAWPSFAQEEDVRGLPKTYIIVNELDPLRDEGVNFYRLLREADVEAQCRQVMGSVHGTEIFLGCPEISDETALSIANFVKN